MPNDISHYFISILSIDQSSMMLISSLRERLVSCDKASSFFEVSSMIRMEKILYPSSPELPQIVQTVQKPSLMVQIIILCDILTSFFNRSQFCFKLNPLVVVEMDVLTYEEASLLIGLEFSSINTLCFEY